MQKIKFHKNLKKILRIEKKPLLLHPAANESNGKATGKL